MVAVPDPIFADPRLAALYDVLDDDRRDLDLYEGLVAELMASSVLDVGCGTGTFACRLAQLRIEVVGLDPAAASLDVARRKPGAEHVRWVLGEAACAPRMGFDLVVMTGNVAQVFVTDGDWSQVLAAMRRAVRSGGWLVFETRDPSRRAWEGWTRERTYREVEVPLGGAVTTWTELTDVQEPVVSFRQVFRFQQEDVEVVSSSTLRFRSRSEIIDSLDAAGFRFRELRDAPDRPGLEHVFLAQLAAEP